MTIGGGMIREEELDEKKILDTIQKNPLGRNYQLDTFIGLLNSINKNTVLSIDGDWGSGKSFFVKQIEYINQFDVPNLPTINSQNITKFQQDYSVYYFNAWENDFHDDPTESLLFSLINDVWSARERTGDKLVKVTQGSLNSALKTITGGLYDAAEIDRAESIADLAKSVRTANERKKAIDDILDNYLELSGKKLLFIIDELDRCKPTYAVKLLEAIKHYYTNDNLVFLLSTNNIQLAHTIKKVYGESFDGAAYLNKFYDLVFNLPRFDVELYLRYLGIETQGDFYKDKVPLEITKYLNMSLRQVNRYYSSLSLIQNYLSSTSGFDDQNVSSAFVKYILIPLAYGLRVTDATFYSDLVNGKAKSFLLEFYNHSDLVRSIVERDERIGKSEDPAGEIIKMYERIVNNEKSTDDSDYDLYRSTEVYHRVVLLMNASGVIDEETTEAEEELSHQ